MVDSARELERTPQSGAPRSVRRTDPDGLAQTLEGCLGRLDSLSAAGTAERLVEVAALCALSSGVRGWWVGRVDGDQVRVVGQGDVRPGPEGPAHRVVPLATLPLRSLTVDPDLAAALEGGSFAGPFPDTPWRAAYAALGIRCAAGAGGYDDDAHQWLVALVDDGTVDVRPLRLLVTAAVHAALGVPLPRRAAHQPTYGTEG
ncbi:hypothetical protein RDV89_06295 [Nocardioides zeae]|uniref:GAF domain-containing protein n=1 Tax=Nocardioides imazamoxiresistens TaxID=3231893 RepID=A0ABU3PTV8_9ACTN|nr:hypothetical protein [Nocardioides zeae]MDT9592667.1 hypothetical protein [Nocardioides zeae]